MPQPQPRARPHGLTAAAALGKPFSSGTLVAAACVGVVLALWLGVRAPADARAAISTGVPLPASDYSVRHLCSAPAPGYASCLALELVPQTTAARAHTHPLAMSLDHAIPAASAAEGAYGLRPADLHSVYGLLTESPVPQTIALVDAYEDPTAEADLAVYDNEFGLAACTRANGCFTKVNQSGNASPLPATNGHWAVETSLDVQTAHAVCQNCHILLVEAENATYSALAAAEETAVRLGATEISNSFGGPERSITIDEAAYNHPGVVITASTGDDGYLNWSSSQREFVGHPDYPATSPHVIAVGGTRLSVYEGRWVGETVWNDAATSGASLGAGGGGCSEHFNAQSWQRAVSDWNEVGCGEKRAAADVAADGDPVSGVAIYDSTPEKTGEQAHWRTIGGTSLASPLVAATFALAGGSGGVSYPSQTLYGRIGEASLHDIQSGSNGRCTRELDLIELNSGCTTEEERQDCSSQLICLAAVGYDGPSGVGTPNGFAAFEPPRPAITAISPTEAIAGGTVTVRGEYLKGVIAVEFGTTKATAVSERSPGELTVTSPEHRSGQVDVTVTTGGGQSATSAADLFTYQPSAPTVSSVQPDTGSVSGGTTVTVTGTNLEGATNVSFGATAATDVIVRSATELILTSPAHAAGTVDVTVTTAGGTSITSEDDHFTYLPEPPPAVMSVEPAQGSTAGGATVTIGGEYLTAVTGVQFDGTPAASFTPISATELTATSPAHTAGTVDVTVTTTAGTSSTTLADRYTYLSAPSNTSAPTISGRAVEGQTLTESHGQWEGSPSSYTYRWLRCDEAGGECSAITGAEEQTYRLLAQDVGHTIKVSETAENIGGSTSAISTPTAVVVTKASIAFTWSGASALANGIGADEWSLADNWAGGVTPSGPVGTISFPSLAADSACDQPQTAACYTSHNDISGLEVQRLVFDDLGGPYVIYGEPITLGAEGIEASTTASTGLAPEIFLPINLGADQEWRIDGGPGGFGVLGTENTISGETRSLTVAVSNKGGMNIAGHPDDEIGPLTVKGANTSNSGINASNNGFLGLSDPATESEPVDRLNVTDGNLVHLQNVAILGSGELGPLTVTEGNVIVGNPFPPDGYPDGRLSVNGALTLDSKTAVQMLMSDRGTTAGVDYTQITSTGTVSLASSELSIFAENYSVCPTLTLGNRYTLVSTAGELHGTFRAIPDGKAIEVSCITGVAPTLRIQYTEHAVIATVVEHLPVNTLKPAITGTTVEGETLSADTGTWEYSPSHYTYSWLRCDSGGSGCSTIAGAEASTYTLASEDGGHAIEVQVSAENASGSTVAISDPTFQIAPRVRSTAAPSITGTPVEASTLVAFPGTWSGSPNRTERQWLRCDSSGENCTTIQSATDVSYTLVSDDVGHTIRVQETATNVGGAQGSAASDPTIAIVARPPSNTAPPSISGAALEGRTLSASDGSWEHNPTSYRYVWQRCDGAGSACSAITGAIQSTYTLTAADVGHTIDVIVTAENTGGISSPVTSTASGLVAAASQPLEGEPHQPAREEPHTTPGPGPTPTPSPSLLGTAQAAGTAPVSGSIAQLALTCTGGGACIGTLTLSVRKTQKRTVVSHGRRRVMKKSVQVRIGQASFSIGAGEHATIVVHLNAAGRKLLRSSKKRISVALSGHGVASRRLSLQVRSRGKHAHAAATPVSLANW